MIVSTTEIENKISLVNSSAIHTR